MRSAESADLCAWITLRSRDTEARARSAQSGMCGLVRVDTVCFQPCLEAVLEVRSAESADLCAWITLRSRDTEARARSAQSGMCGLVRVDTVCFQPCLEAGWCTMISGAVNVAKSKKIFLK